MMVLNRMYQKMESHSLYEKLKSLDDYGAVKEIRAMLGMMETAELDFVCKKDPTRAELEDDDKRNYAKALSGFSNSQGGLVIWGVDARRRGNDPETPDEASGFKPIANVKAFASNLDRLLSNAITQTVFAVENRPTTECLETGQGYCLTWIPEGISPPYRTNLQGFHHYYKRAGNGFYEMEPYDIRDVVFRFKYPKLRVELSKRPVEKHEGVEALDVQLFNCGPVSLRAFSFVVEIPHGFRFNSRGIASVHGLPLRSGLAYDAYVVKSVVGCPPWSGSGEIVTYYIREPIYPGQSVHLLGGNSGRGFSVRTDLQQIGVSPLLYWTLHGDDMPSLCGEYHFITDGSQSLSR